MILEAAERRSSAVLKGHFGGFGQSIGELPDIFDADLHGNILTLINPARPGAATQEGIIRGWRGLHRFFKR